MDQENNAYGIELGKSAPKTESDAKQKLLSFYDTGTEVDNAITLYGVSAVDLLLAMQIKQAVSNGELTYLSEWN